MVLTEDRDNAGVIAPPPLIALAAVVLGLALDRLLPAYVLTVLLTWWERVVIAVILLGAGGALAIAALLGFRSAGTHVEPWKPATALVTGGIFAWLRNPMYVALTLFLMALSLALVSDWTAGDDRGFRPGYPFRRGQARGALSRGQVWRRLPAI